MTRALENAIEQKLDGLHPHDRDMVREQMRLFIADKQLVSDLMRARRKKTKEAMPPAASLVELCAMQETTAADIAKRLRQDRKYVYDRLAVRYPPRLKTLDKLVGALGAGCKTRYVVRTHQRKEYELCFDGPGDKPSPSPVFALPANITASLAALPAQDQSYVLDTAWRALRDKKRIAVLEEAVEGLRTRADRDAAKALPIIFLRDLRESLNVPQERLAKKTGIHRPTISRIETGKSNPHVSTLDRVLSGMGCTLLPLAVLPGQGEYMIEGILPPRPELPPATPPSAPEKKSLSALEAGLGALAPFAREEVLDRMRAAAGLCSTVRDIRPHMKKEQTLSGIGAATMNELRTALGLTFREIAVKGGFYDGTEVRQHFTRAGRNPGLYNLALLAAGMGGRLQVRAKKFSDRDGVPVAILTDLACCFNMSARPVFPGHAAPDTPPGSLTGILQQDQADILQWLDDTAARARALGQARALLQEDTTRHSGEVPAMSLMDLRTHQAPRLTKKNVVKASGLSRFSVRKLEKKGADVLVSTFIRHARGLGYEPEFRFMLHTGASVRLTDFDGPVRRRRPSAGKVAPR